MPAYSFMPRFVEPIRAGTKGGTIRAPRKYPDRWSTFARARRPGGHAIAGEFVDLYCRQRSPSGFFIRQFRCHAVERIILNFDRQIVAFRDRADADIADLDRFARFDGFDSWHEMRQFWESTHHTGYFEGWHIRWADLPS